MKYKVLKSMLSIMLISTLSFTAVGCGNEASQEGVSAVFGTMESEDEVVDNINDTLEPQVVAENSDTQSTEEDTQVKEDTQVEENDSQETSSELSEESKDNSNTGSSKEDKPSESHKDDRPSETHKDDKKDDNHEEHKHTHTWKPVYKTIHHKAVTHKEDKGHYEDQGYDVTVSKCGTCGKEFTDFNELAEHKRVSREINPNDPDKWHGGSSTYTKHVEKKVWVSKWVTVVDKEAWDEKVLDHYECSCGATKKK